MPETSTIKSVAIIGAGALGLLYMDSMEQKSGVEVYFLSDSKRCETLKKTTFTINGKKRQFPTKNLSDLTTKPDLIIICVKNHHLESLRGLLQNTAESGTIIISVLNGISSEGYLEQILPKSDVLYCAVLGMDALKENNLLSFSRKGKFLLGTKENRDTFELQKVCRFLQICHLDYLIPQDIHREIWYKWMINIGVNQVSAITGAPYGLFQNNNTVQELMELAMKEVIKVAEAEQVNLTEADIERWYLVLNTLGPEGKTSMLQDMEAGRKTEVESFSGELIKRALLYGMTTPVNEILYRTIKIRELLF